MTCHRSVDERPAAGVRYHYPNDLDRLTTKLDAFAYEGCGEPLVNEASEHLGLEPMSDHQQTVDSAMRVFGNQL
jgi:hypothetical protein